MKAYTGKCTGKAVSCESISIFHYLQKFSRTVIYNLEAETENAHFGYEKRCQPILQVRQFDIYLIVNTLLFYCEHQPVNAT
jgi:hypothetical protein